MFSQGRPLARPLAFLLLGAPQPDSGPAPLGIDELDACHLLANETAVIDFQHVMVLAAVAAKFTFDVKV